MQLSKLLEGTITTKKNDTLHSLQNVAARIAKFVEQHKNIAAQYPHDIILEPAIINMEVGRSTKIQQSMVIQIEIGDDDDIKIKLPNGLVKLWSNEDWFKRLTNSDIILVNVDNYEQILTTLFNNL